EGDLAAGAPGELLREFAAERDELLDEERTAVAVFVQNAEPVVRVLRRVDDAHALAVVAAAGCLEHGATAVSIEKRLQLIAGCHGCPLRGGDADLGELRAHRDLVLGVRQGTGSWPHGDAG